MKQLLNSLSTGEIILQNVSKPSIKSNEVLIKNYYSAISVGTEKMLVDFGKANYFQKAKQQPERVKEVVDKVKTDGFSTTYNAIKSKLDQPIPLGYSSVGEVIEVGSNVTDFKVGDKVISNGSHSEIVAVNKNLVAKVPENVNLKDAAFTVISSIPLQGIRLLKPEIGDTVVVIGLGLMGLIASQILIANGCKVIGSDVDEKKVELAKMYGVDAINVKSGIDIVNYVNEKTDNYGADKVLITASTKSNEPITQAAKMCRQRGQIVLVGVIGLNLDRSLFYEKEITFQVSSSYGPGRYDKNYEEKGIDYPYGFVRWTENRNFQAILSLMQRNKLSFDLLITNKVDFKDAAKAYNDLSNNTNVIGALFKYEHENVDLSDQVTNTKAKYSKSGELVIGIVGAGNYTNQTLLPKIDQKYRLKLIGSKGGLNASFVSEKHGIEKSTSNIENIFNDNEINTVIITTRHDSHSSLVIKSLENNKSVFVEKPLALNHDQLNLIKNAYYNSDKKLMVGFNRRFSPLTVKMKELLGELVSPKNINITINAGKIPKDHWTQDVYIGGGRLIGEACHFIDLAMFLAGSKIKKSNIVGMKTSEETYDTFTIILSFEDGSIANINYFSNGDKSYPKENIKVSCEGKILEIDNFKHLKGYGFNKFKHLRGKKQDKGHEECINKFLNSLSYDQELIPFEEILQVSQVCIDLDNEMRNLL